MSISFDPGGIRRSEFESFYAKRLRVQKYSVIALAFETSPALKLPAKLYLAPQGSATYRELIRVMKVGRLGRGLRDLTKALENDPSYRLIAIGPYGNSDHLAGSNSPGLYAIWARLHGK